MRGNAMTNAPQDLMDHRSRGRSMTGLDAIEWGIVGDGSHTTGYHVGVQTIIARGNYPDEDYSTRLIRDRVGGDDASAEDIGDNWPAGGRTAWLRFNNSLIDEYYHHPERLPNLCEMNFSRDGIERKRYRPTDGVGIVNTTDTVDSHTHLGFWRDRSGRAETLARIEEHIAAAIAGVSVDQGEDMTLTPQEHDLLLGAAGRIDAMYNNLPMATIGYSLDHNQPNALKAKLDAILSGEQVIDVNALASAIVTQINAAGHNVDVQTVVDALESVAGQTALVDAANTAEDN